MRRVLAFGSLALAALLLVVPLPATWAEHIYARGIYPRWARAVVPRTGAVPFACLDVLVIAFAVTGTIAALRSYRRRRSGSRVAGIGAAVGAVAVVASIGYLWFLASWGFNYQRAPLRTRIDYDRARVTPDAARQLARQMVGELNRLHPLAWSNRWPALEELPSRLAASVDRTAVWLGLPTAIRGASPKRSLLQPYFRWAGIDGVTNPFLPEIIVNVEALPTERAYIVAHEWGHVLGLAHEAEAGFAGWRICLGADDQSRYSAWLSIYGSLMGAIPASVRAPIVAGLADGPRRDLRAIAARYELTVPAVRGVAWATYDQYLRSHRVTEGVASYDAIVDLMLGARPPQ